jgi:tRNA pseudouridine38-40 synthase
LNSSSKFVLLVEYDGTRYHGFQWQAKLPTIQNELEQAIRQLGGLSSRVIGASRTDAGVHARGQVVGFWTKSSLDTTSLVRALNYHLPNDIAIKAAYRAGADFGVRRDALSREYRYYIMNSATRSPLSQAFSLFVPGKLNVEAMNQACRLMLGEHDFASFASCLDAGKSTVRRVHEAGVEERGDFKVFRIVASSFLPHQVRSTVGLLVRLGLGKLGIGEFRDIMGARSQGLAGPVYPPRGLCLMRVNYGGPLGS